MKRHKGEFDDSTVSYIQNSIRYYNEISTEESGVREEINSSIERLENIENKERIYVYSFPHYVKHPSIESEDGLTDERYMLKIGMTSVEVVKRIKQQKTAMPEDPVLYYVFSLGKSNLSLAEAEKKLHDHLRSIGHRRPTDAGGGTEWFVTNFETIMSCSGLMGLNVEYALLEHDQADHN